MPDKTLHELAHETRDATAALRRLLDHQKAAAKRRMIWVTLLYVPFAMIVAGFVTVTTVSVCFLTRPEEQSPRFCKVMPGYTEITENNEQLVIEFRQLQKRSVRNEHRIDRLEEKARG